MPPLPQMDVSGLFELFTLILVSLVVIWGLHKAIYMAK